MSAEGGNGGDAGASEVVAEGAGAGAKAAPKWGPGVVIGRIREVIGLSVLLYVFGFLIVRARLAVLGVHAGLPIASLSYFTEGGTFLIDTLESLLPWGMAALVVVGGLALIIRLPGPAGAFEKLRARSKFASSAWRPALVLGAQLAACFVATKLVDVTTNLPSLAIHVLVPNASGRRPDSDLVRRLDAGGADAEYIRVLAVLVFTILVTWAFHRESARAPVALRIYVIALLALEVLLLPLNYAVLEWQPRYLVATLKLKDEVPPLPSPTFVLHEEEHFLVAYADDRIRTIARDEVLSMTAECYAKVLSKEPCPGRAAPGAAFSAGPGGAEPASGRDSAGVVHGAGSPAVVDGGRGAGQHD